MRSPRRGMCAAVLCLEAITVALATPVMIAVNDVRTSTALLVGVGLAVICLLLAGMLRAGGPAAQREISPLASMAARSSSSRMIGTIGKSYLRANSKSRWSPQGTAMTAPVP